MNKTEKTKSFLRGLAHFLAACCLILLYMVVA